MPPKRSGPPYRRQVVTFWRDPDVRPLPLAQKTTLQYLFTGPDSHPCGVYYLPPWTIARDLKLDEDEVTAWLTGPLSPFVTLDQRTEEVFVRSMARHQFDKPLVGGDKRIPWMAGHLHTIQSRRLRMAFYTAYNTWNLPWSELLTPEEIAEAIELPLFSGLRRTYAENEGASHAPSPEDSSGPASSPASEGTAIPGNPSNEAKKEGASDAPSDAPSGAPSSDPEPGAEVAPESPDETPDVENSGSPAAEPKTKGLPKGHAMPVAVAVAVTDPVAGNLQPSSEDQPSPDQNNRREGDPLTVELLGRPPGTESEKHPDLGSMWRRLRGHILEGWHRGAEFVVLDTQRVGVGLEYWLLNDLLHVATRQGLPSEAIAFFVEQAPVRLAWPREPRTLHWLLRPENFRAAQGVYLSSQPITDVSEFVDLDGFSMGSESA